MWRTTVPALLPEPCYLHRHRHVEANAHFEYEVPDTIYPQHTVAMNRTCLGRQGTIEVKYASAFFRGWIPVQGPRDVDDCLYGAIDDFE